MSTRARFAAVAATAVLALSACGHSVSSGTVYDKEHDAAKSSRVCAKYSGTGSKKRCVKWKTKTEPEHWELKLRDKDGNEGEVHVDQATYDQYQVGDHYPKS